MFSSDAQLRILSDRQTVDILMELSTMILVTPGFPSSSMGRPPNRIFVMTKRRKEKMMRRRFVMATALFCAGLCLLRFGVASPAEAAAQSAREFVQEIYDSYQGIDPEGVTLSTDDAVRHYFTPQMAQILIDGSNKAQAAGDVPVLDGDPFVDSQDWQIADLTIRVNDAATAKTTAVIKFKNRNKPTVIKLDLLKVGGAWKIDNIRWPEGSLRQRIVMKGKAK
jgi:uncharacterized protein DUF3828